MAIFEMTMLFLGSIIGAGFATGAEIITFFGKWQLSPWLIASIIGIAIFLMITLEIVLFYPTKTSPAPIKPNKKLYIGIVMIYLILFTAMTAGITQITNPIICLISLIFSAIIALLGTQKLTHFNRLIVPIIIVLIITTALPHTSSMPTPPQSNQHLIPTLFWAMLYAGLNCFMFPEFIIANATHVKRRDLFWAGLLTAGLVTVLAGLILSTIQATQTTTEPIPLLSAAPTPITVLVILLAILTSQYTTLFAITERLGQIIPSTKNKPLMTVACVCLIALIGSLCGFTHIIQYGYPLIGALTCFYLLFSFLQRFWQVSHGHQL